MSDTYYSVNPISDRVIEIKRFQSFGSDTGEPDSTIYLNLRAGIASTEWGNIVSSESYDKYLAIYKKWVDSGSEVGKMVVRDKDLLGDPVYRVESNVKLDIKDVKFFELDGKYYKVTGRDIARTTRDSYAVRVQRVRVSPQHDVIPAGPPGQPMRIPTGSPMFSSEEEFVIYTERKKMYPRGYHLSKTANDKDLE